MKKRDKVLESTFLLEGWTDECKFAHLTVWCKHNERVLWDPKTTEVVLTYTHYEKK